MVCICPSFKNNSCKIHDKYCSRGRFYKDRLAGENGRRLRAQWDCLYSAKAVPKNGAPSLDCCKASICGSGKYAASMAAENCANAQKIHPDTDMLWSRRIFCVAIFCRYWTCTFSCRNNQAIGAEVVCIFTFFYNSFVCQMAMGTAQEQWAWCYSK